MRPLRLAALLLIHPALARAGCTPQLLWQAAYDNANQEEAAYGIVADASGNVIVGGATSSYNGQSTGSYYVRKYSSAGVALWTSATLYSGTMGYPQWCAVAVDSVSGEIAFATPGDFNTNNGRVGRLAPNGTLRWSQPMTGAVAVAIAGTDPSASVYCWGSGMLSRFNAAGGAAAWTVGTGGGAAGMGSIVLDEFQNVYLAIPNGSSFWTVAKRTASGSPVWSLSETPASARAIVRDAGGFIYVGGTSGGTFGNFTGPVDWLVHKYRDQGSSATLEQEFRSPGGSVTSAVNGDGNHGAWGVAVDSAGGVYAAGVLLREPCSGTTGTTNQTVAMVVKWAASGAREWRLPIRADTRGCSSDMGYGVAVPAGSTDVLFAGQISSYDSGQRQNFFVSRYRQGAGCDEAPLADNALQIRNNIVRRSRGEVAYLTVKSVAGGDVDVTVYGVSGKRLGGLNTIQVAAGGTAELEFDGTVEGINLPSGTYWIVATGAAHGRQPVVLLRFNDGN